MIRLINARHVISLIHSLRTETRSLFIFRFLRRALSSKFFYSSRLRLNLIMLRMLKEVANLFVFLKIGSASLTDAVNYFAVNLTDVSTVATNSIFGIVTVYFL